MKTELSEKNKYYLDKNRYLELKYFCLQYPIWKEAHKSIDILATKQLENVSNKNCFGSPATRYADASIFLQNRMLLIENTCKEADEFLSKYLLHGVTEGRSYDIMCATEPIPCCRECYYKAYRKFFWLLNKYRK